MEGLMKAVIVMLSLALIVGYAFQGWEGEQLRSDLIGRMLGERETGWIFQSRSQIKELLINDKKEDEQHRIYSITLTLQDPKVPGVYKAEADVTYNRVGSGWKIEHVGLKSLKKIE